MTWKEKLTVCIIITHIKKNNFIRTPRINQMMVKKSRRMRIITLMILNLLYFLLVMSMQMTQGRCTEALLSIKRLRGLDYDAGAEIEDIRTTLNSLHTVTTSTWDALRRKATIRALIIACGLMIFFQMSGINAITFFSTAIFRAANSTMASEVETIIIGACQLLGTVTSIFLMDRLGRRVLLLVSAVSCAFTTLVIGIYFELLNVDPKDVEQISWLPLISMSLFFFLFSFGYGPIAWIMIGELFAPDIKGECGGLV